MTSADPQSFRRDYRPPFLAYLNRPEEKGLHAAYELGRAAMRAELGLLTVVRVHHEVFIEVLATVRDVRHAEGLARSAADFLVEALASFEMTQRGFMSGDVLPPPEGRMKQVGRDRSQ